MGDARLVIAGLVPFDDLLANQRVRLNKFENGHRKEAKVESDDGRGSLDEIAHHGRGDRKSSYIDYFVTEFFKRYMKVRGRGSSVKVRGGNK